MYICRNTERSLFLTIHFMRYLSFTSSTPIDNGMEDWSSGQTSSDISCPLDLLPVNLLGYTKS